MRSCFGTILLLLSLNGYSQSFLADTIGCAPLTISLENPFQVYDELYWDFGNGVVSTVEDPTVSYINPGNYTVTLCVKQGSQFDTLASFYQIEVLEAPFAQFSTVFSGECSGSNTVLFSNTSTQFDSVYWNFGDGHTSNLINPNHSYQTSGLFNPMLVVTNSHGCHDNAVLSPFQIFEKPNIQYTIQLDSACAFSDSSLFVISGNFTQLQVEIKGLLYINQDSIFANYNFLIENNIEIIAWTPQNCSDTLIIPSSISDGLYPDFSLDLLNHSICANQQTNFQITSASNAVDSVHWFVNQNFSSDSVVFTLNPILNQNYVVLAKIYSGNCVFLIDTTFLIELSGPILNSIVMDSLICKNEFVEIPISTSETDQINWSVNGLYVGNSDTLRYVFNTGGAHTIHLNLVDSNLCETDLQYLVNVNSLSADFTVLNSVGCAPNTSTFICLTSGVASVNWDFGDGTFATGNIVQHAYLNPGFYSPKLIVFDAITGCSDTLTKVNYIKIMGNGIDFDTLYIEACGSYEFKLANFNIGNSYWNWNYGDGGSSSGQNPNHLYTNPGLYEVSLQTASPSGCQAVAQAMFIIRIYEVNYPTVNALAACPNFDVFLDSIASAYSVNWYINGLFSGQFDTLLVTSSDILNGLVKVSYQYIDSNLCAVKSEVSMLVDCPGFGAPNILTGGGLGGGSGTYYPDTLVVCRENAVSFSSLQIPPPFALVHFYPGDGNVLSTFPSNYLYNSAGVFQPYLIVISSGQIDTFFLSKIYKIVEVIPNLQVSLLPESCDLIKLHLADSLNSGTDIQYVISGDSTYSGNFVECFLPNQNGYITIDYELENSYGCTYSESKIIAYSKFKLEALSPNRICFGDSALFCSDVSLDAFPHAWHFGDGASASFSSGFHQYQTSGVFFPFLAVDNNFGCLDTLWTDSLTVVDPQNGFSNSSLIFCKGTVVHVQADIPADTYLWTINSGSYPQDSSVFEFVFNYSGFYNINLVSTIQGCVFAFTDTIEVVQPNVQASTSQNRMCFPLDLTISLNLQNVDSINWLFNNGTSLMNGPADSILTLNANEEIVFQVWDENGCSHADTIVALSIWDNFSLDTLIEECVPSNLTINAPQNVAEAYWDFGNGNVDTTLNLNQQYLTSGTFKVQPTFIMSDGCEAVSDTITIRMHSIDLNSMVQVNSFCAPVIANFNSYGSLNVNNFLWDFGDGSTSNLANPAHVYSESGLMQVVLYGSNSFGCLDTFAFNNQIIVSTAAVDISFSMADLCVGDSSHLILNNANNFSSIFWTFGDGNSASIPDVWNDFQNEGDYSITIAVVDTLGCFSTTTLDSTIQIFSYPDFTVELYDSLYCISDDLNFLVVNPDSVVLEWSLNSVLINPNLPLLTTGLNILHVNADNNGCSKSFVDSILVFDSLDIQLLSDSIFCISNQSVFLETNFNNGVWTGSNLIDSLSGEISLQNFGVFLYLYEIGDACNSNASFLIYVDSNISAEFTLDSVQCFGSIDLVLNPENSNGSWYLNNQAFNLNIMPALDPGNYNLSHAYANGLCYDSIVHSFSVIEINEIDLVLDKNINCFQDSIEFIYSPNVNTQVEFFGINMITQDTLLNLDSISNIPGEWSMHYTISDLNGCSNSFFVDNLLILDSLQPTGLELIRSTVVNDQFVFTEWKADSLDLLKMVDIQIFRSELNTNNWNLIDQVSSNQTSYEDFSSQVHDMAYEYKIKANYHCPWFVENPESVSILLQVEDQGDFKRFYWNAYDKWPEGVQYYYLQFLNEGVWETQKVLPANVLETIEE